MTEEEIQALREQTQDIANEEASTSSEEDLHVQLRTPVFAAGQVKRARVSKVSTDTDGQSESGLVVLVTYEVLEELTDVNGREYAPGQYVTSRLTINSTHPSSAEVIQSIGRQDLCRFAMATGAIPYSDTGNWTEALSAVADTVDKEVMLAFGTREDKKKKNDNGEPILYQTLTPRTVDNNN